MAELEAKVRGALEEAFGPAEISIETDGGCTGAKMTIRVVSEKFATMKKLERQRNAEKALKEWRETDEVHAVTWKLQTPSEAG